MSNAGSVVLGVVLVAGAGGYYAYEEGWFKAKTDPTEAAAIEAAKRPQEPTRSPDEIARSKSHVVPDLMDLEVDAARKAVTSAGFPSTALVVKADTACSYASDKDMKAVGAICSQDPAAGATVSGLTDIKVAVERDTYEEGSVGFSSEWRRMPDLRGETLESAREILRDKGFGDAEFTVDPRADCKKGTVCSTRPDPGARKVTAQVGTLWVP